LNLSIEDMQRNKVLTEQSVGTFCLSDALANRWDTMDGANGKKCKIAQKVLL